MQFDLGSHVLDELVEAAPAASDWIRCPYRSRENNGMGRGVPDGNPACAERRSQAKYNSLIREYLLLLQLRVRPCVQAKCRSGIAFFGPCRTRESGARWGMAKATAKADATAEREAMAYSPPPENERKTPLMRESTVR